MGLISRVSSRTYRKKMDKGLGRFQSSPMTGETSSDDEDVPKNISRFSKKIHLSTDSLESSESPPKPRNVNNFSKLSDKIVLGSDDSSSELEKFTTKTSHKPNILCRPETTLTSTTSKKPNIPWSSSSESNDEPNQIPALTTFTPQPSRQMFYIKQEKTCKSSTPLAQPFSTSKSKGKFTPIKLEANCSSGNSDSSIGDK